MGPPETPYEGGVFHLTIDHNDKYPYKPPKTKFITKIYHPQVRLATGEISIDILINQWSAALTIRTLMHSIQSLMSDFYLNDPLEPEIAKEIQEDKLRFELKAREYTFKYAMEH